MSRPPRKALLIGVTDYDDPAIDSLPFITDDLDDLGKALGSIGYEVEHHPPRHGDRDRIDTAIEQFCRRAQPGQQLLIFLSGHGIHRDGRDYLLPSSADTTSRKFTERCLEIDFGGHIEESRCGDVLVVVDACREGVRLREKAGYGYVQSWSRQQRERSADRTIAYLYACSSGELARWRDTPDGTFSLFTRAFSRALTDVSVAGTLTAVRDAIGVRLDELSATLGVPPQKPHLDGDPESCARFRLVDRLVRAAASRGAAGWADRAHAHAVWDLAGSGLAGALRDATVDCAAAWSRRYLELRRDLVDDPWWDDELAIRMHDRLSWVVKHVLNPGKLTEGDKPPLSPAEAAVLVLMPYAQQLHRAQCAVTDRAVLEDRGDEAGEFRRFVDGQRRVQRRLVRLQASGEHAHAGTVRWSAYHRWLAQRPQLYRTTAVAGCLLAILDPPAGDADELLRDVISGERLARLLRALRSDPEADAVAAADLPAGTRTIAGGTPNEQQVRDRLLGLILLVAEEFTIDAAALPNIVTDHIGLQGGVEVAEVLRAVQTARWSARGRTRVLEADCPHQSVQVALAEHTQGIAEVLRRIDAAAESDRMLEALRDLPTHVAADGLRPLPRPDGRPRYDNVGFRFRLDDDRVQELLMGEQLYGDPALAIRELYQNALDACRYRRARTLHLRKTGQWVAEWTGQIAFSQGVDNDGRAWLECRDNGIGMSERELSSVFSHAGARFADLPEFLEEQAAWDREEIEFYPNSRFGVGVLSYFMLGDEISVSTARLSQAGVLLPRLQVDIDGPGSLCRIGETDGTGESGTTVRVFLRSGLTVSCVDLLTRLLWVSDFEVTAADGSGQAAWAPGVLSPRAPVGTGDPMAHYEPGLPGEVNVAIVDPLPTAVRHVWWCDRNGAILADGLWAGAAPFGRIVSLTGPLAPRLTVDRRRILTMDTEATRELLRRAIPDLLAGTPTIATLNWIGRLAGDDVQLADQVAQAMIDAEVSFPAAGGVTIKTALVGVFPPDETLFGRGDYRGEARYRSGDVDRDDPIAGRRLRDYVRAGLVRDLRLASDEPGPVLVRPSDAILMSYVHPEMALPRAAFRFDPQEVLRGAVALDWSPRRVADRLRELGAQVPELAWPEERLDGDDQGMLSYEEGGRRLWLDLSAPVAVGHVMRAAMALGQSPGRVAGRLSELGARLPDYRWPDEPLRSHDRRLLSCDDRSLEPWLDTELPGWLDLMAPVPATHIIAAAVELVWSPERVAGRLCELGAQVPEIAWPAVPLSVDDRRVLSLHSAGNGPWLDLSWPVTVGQVTVAAAVVGWSPGRVAGRLHELGARVADCTWAEAPPSEDDRRLLSSDPRRPGSWLDLMESVPAGHVLAAAAALRWSPRLVASRLRGLGAALGDHAWPDLPSEDPDDRKLLSTDLDGQYPWLDLTAPVTRTHVLRAGMALGWPPRRAAERLREWGASVPDLPWPDARLSDDDRRLLAYDEDDPGGWSMPAPVLALDLARPVQATYVIGIGAAMGWSPRRVVDRLLELGAQVPDGNWSEVRLTRDDQRLLSRDGDGRHPWLDLSGPVPAGQVMGVAAALGRSPRGVADRFLDLGIEVASFAWPDITLSGDDRRLLSVSVNGQGPWLELPGPASAGHIFGAASALGRTPRQIAERLRELGAEVPDLPWPSRLPSPDDLQLMSRDLDGQGPWVAFAHPVGAARLLPGPNGTRLSIGRAAERLLTFGATLDRKSVV